jgi:hypothetical protein
MLTAFDSDVRRENTDVRWVGFSLKAIVTFSKDIFKFFYSFPSDLNNFLCFSTHDIWVGENQHDTLPTFRAFN